MKKNIYAVIEQKLFKSKPYRCLTGKAPHVLSLFWCKRQMLNSGKKGHERWQCTNKKKLIFTYAEAIDKWGITECQFRFAITSLIKFGFIDIVQPGGALFKNPTIYGLSDRWQDYGTADFKEKTRPLRGIDYGFCKQKEKKT